MLSIVADEARYHIACHDPYISKANLQYSGFHEGRQETSCDAAFQKMAEDISVDLDGGKAFSVSMVLDRYKDFLREQ